MNGGSAVSRGPAAAAGACLAGALVLAIEAAWSGVDAGGIAAAVGLLVAALLLARRRREAPWVLALAVLADAGTVAAAAHPGGGRLLDLGMPALLLLLLCVPSVRGVLGPGGAVKPVPVLLPIAAAALALVIVGLRFLGWPG